ncbi:hypothetical protein BKA56DRAFT_666664 [Ilyonectria sp. MPI-CAGE-AT-0026]|nr:hypothetical protein BKA56DRAFT_666664 [Ilyonectria sp. MPI-CAGE-AT-0026]
MRLLHIISALVIAAIPVTALGAIPFVKLYAAALKGKVRGKPREYQPHEWAFEQKCTNIRLVGHGIKGQTTLQAVCVDHWKRRWLTELNLNRCLSMVRGEFAYYAWANQTFDAACYDCKLFHSDEDHTLIFACACLDANCDLQPISAQLGGESLHAAYVKPSEGRLVCGAEKGTKEFVANGSIAMGWLRIPE